MKKRKQFPRHPKQLLRIKCKLIHMRSRIAAFIFDKGPLRGKTMRRLNKWMNGFNKLTRRLIK